MTVSETSDTLQWAQQKVRRVSEAHHSSVTEVAELHPTPTWTGGSFPRELLPPDRGGGVAGVSASGVSETVVSGACCTRYRKDWSLDSVGGSARPPTLEVGLPEARVTC